MPRGAPWNPKHADAEMGDSVPHMRQVKWELLAEQMHGGGELVRVEGRDFFFGRASGEDNNCLIDTLRQKLGNMVCSLEAVRVSLMAEFPSGPRRVTDHNYLELEHHWRHVIEFLGTNSPTGNALDPSRFRIVCIDRRYPGNGDVEGDGAVTLFIARVNANHFVPLIPYHGRRSRAASSSGNPLPP